MLVFCEGPEMFEPQKKKTAYINELPRIMCLKIRSASQIVLVSFVIDVFLTKHCFMGQEL